MALTASRSGTRPDLAVIVLAAGAGARMKSSTPKPLHKVAGLPMIEHVLRAAEALKAAEIAIVASTELNESLQIDVSSGRFTVVVQDPPRGTGDAVHAGLQALEESSAVLILYADHPMVTSDELASLIAGFQDSNALVGVMTCIVEDAAGYGRIQRNDNNALVAVVELVDDLPAKRQGSTEINSGIMMLDAAWARATLPNVPPNAIKHEVFLTDLVALAALDPTHPVPVVAVTGSADVLIGVNDRAELAVADELMRRRIRLEHLRNGVTIIGPETVFIDSDVVIGSDATILPYTMLLNGTSIRERCTIGPYANLERSVVGDDSHVESSTIRDSEIGSSCHVGPYSHLRNGTLLDDHVHIGNFVEAKNARIASHVRAGHMSYLGDTTIGESTNIGAGTVTCNFDGVDKHHTEIGAKVFIGSDTMLVAPITIGDEAATGAGSVVTRNVDPGVKVVGVPARPVRRREADAGAKPPGQGA